MPSPIGNRIGRIAIVRRLLVPEQRSKVWGMTGTHHSDELRHSVCLTCTLPMRMTLTEDMYPGYHRRIFECQTCGCTMTEWAAVPRTKRSVKHRRSALDSRMSVDTPFQRVRYRLRSNELRLQLRGSQPQT